MKRFHWLLLGFAASVCIAAVAPTGGGGSSGVPTLNGTATNLQVYSSGTTNRPLRVYGTNGEAAYIDKDGKLDLASGIDFGGNLYYKGSYFSINTTAGGVNLYGSLLYGNGTTLRLGRLDWLGPVEDIAQTASSKIYWSAGGLGNSTVDSGLSRNAAGVLEINNGTPGTYRDLRLRTLYGEGGTVTASAPVLDISQTWNNAGVNFTAAKVNVTNTASGSASKLADFQTDGTSQFAFYKNGNFGIRTAGWGEFLFTQHSTYGFGLKSPDGNWVFAAQNDGGLAALNLWAASSGRIGFKNTTFYDGAMWQNQSIALERISDEQLKVTQPTGSFGDIVLRSTFATNASITNITADSYVTTQQTLSYASATNLTVDANKSLHFVSLTNTAYFAQPSNLGVGRTFTVILQQDGTGTRAVMFNTNYWKFPGGVVPTITTNANAYDVLSCISCPYGTNVFAIHNAKFQ